MHTPQPINRRVLHGVLVALFTLLLFVAPIPPTARAGDVPAFSGTIRPLTSDDRAGLPDLPWAKPCAEVLPDLVALHVTHFGDDGGVHEGVLVVHRLVADELLEIFRDLYEARFPVAKMARIEEYGGSDDLSMADNNTSAFNCRVATGSNKMSVHALGRAVDINPLVNPYVKGDTVLPPEGREFRDRTLARPGLIVEGGPCHRAFVSRGWTWGGNWQSLKDYQHFEKKE